MGSAAKVDPSETVPSATPSASTVRPGSRGLPLAVPLEHRELFARLYDPDHMCAVFAQVLPALAEREIRVRRCRAKPGRSEKAFVKGMIELVYTLSIEVEGEAARDFVLLGISPVAAGFPG